MKFNVKRPSRPKDRRRFLKPLVESLEDRRLLAAIISVNSTLDTNARDANLTLREAILINNRTLSIASLSAAELLRVSGLPTNSDSDTISFNIPPSDAGHIYYKNDGLGGQVNPANVAATTAGNDSAIADIDPDWPHSWFSIAPTSPLPLLTEPATIDGSRHPGSIANSNPVGLGLNSLLKIELNGENAGQVEFGLIGISSTAGGSTVRGIVVNRTTGPKVMFESGAANNRVEGSFLGPDISGTIAFPPPAVEVPGFLRSNGVFAWTGGNTIGGGSPDKRNLISGNNFVTSSLDAGVILRGFGAPSVVEGNLIGTDRTGTRALGNVGYGVLIDSPNNIIGGAGLGNVISGNQAGIYAASGNNTGGVIQGNWIGTDVSGTLDLGNAGDGILFGSFAGGNRVESNTIGFNQNGIRASTQNQLITRNSIFSNDELGIMGLHHAPALTSVTAIAGGTRIAGTQAGVEGESFRIEFFGNPERDEFIPMGTFLKPGQVGEGKSYLGELVVTIPAGGTANFSVDLPVDLLALPGVGGQPFVTATATDITDAGGESRNKTSEFSLVAVLGGPSFVVTTTADTGLGTLREAIYSANLTPGAETITFAIPASDPRHFYYTDDGIADSVTLANLATTSAATDAEIPTTGASAIDPDWPHSWLSIRPGRALPAVIDRVTIDGYTQPGSLPNTLPAPQGLNTVLRVEVDGSSASGSGLTLDGQSFLVKIAGLVINRWSGDGISALNTTGGHSITGNFVGTDVSGTRAQGNGQNGIFLENELADVIGGASAHSRNLIGGNGDLGIAITSGGGNEIAGNLVGVNRHVTEEIADRGGSSIGIDDSTFNIVGGLIPEAANALLVDAGIWVLPRPSLDDPAVAVTSELQLDIVRCLIIRKSLKSFVDPDTYNADFLASCFSNLVVKYGDGIRPTINDINHNRFVRFIPILGPEGEALGGGSGPLLGIDLGNDGITPNREGNRIDGPNGLQTFPAISSSTAVASGTVIAGTLNSLPGSSFRIEYYLNTVGPSFRAGEQYLGFTNITTNSLGNALFTFTSPNRVPAGQYVTATATWLLDADGDPLTPLDPIQTSEFSDVIAVRENPWHNQDKALDVTGDGNTLPQDALDVINYVNAFGIGPVPASAVLGVPAYYDTTNDAFVTASDALAVINHINAFGFDLEGEGNAEAEGGKMVMRADTSPPHAEDLLALLANDLAEHQRERRRTR